MPKCAIHPDTELICPKCRAATGGATRAKHLTKAERSESASKAAKARWAGETPAERRRFAKRLLRAREAKRQKGESP